MKIRCYVSKDGEVLSNKQYPVNRPLLVIPESVGEPIPVNAVSELELTELKWRNNVYKAVTIDIPDDFLNPVDGIIS